MIFTGMTYYYTQKSLNFITFPNFLLIKVVVKFEFKITITSLTLNNRKIIVRFIP